jgi:phage FluMu protein Com
LHHALGDERRDLGDAVMQRRSASPAPTPATECRCLCKRLLARATSEGIEVKCGRCQRVLLITWPDARIIDVSGSANSR